MQRINWKNRAKRLEYIITEISWMARRYADGRCTYAPSMYNDAIMEAIELGVPLRPDTALKENPTLFAREGK